MLTRFIQQFGEKLKSFNNAIALVQSEFKNMGVDVENQ